MIDFSKKPIISRLLSVTRIMRLTPWERYGGRAATCEIRTTSRYVAFIMKAIVTIIVKVVVVVIIVVVKERWLDSECTGR